MHIEILIGLVGILFSLIYKLLVEFMDNCFCVVDKAHRKRKAICTLCYVIYYAMLYTRHTGSVRLYVHYVMLYIMIS